MTSTPALRAFLLCAALIFTGCATDDAPTSSGNGGGGGGGRTVKADPGFALDIQEIFDRRGCTGSSCHGSGTQADLDLRTGTSYGELVDVQSFQPSPLVRVRPGHAQDSSYVVDKLDGSGLGQRMPQGGAPLDSIDMNNIINWINQGAKNN